VPGENLWDGRTLASLTDAAIYIAFIFRRIEMAGINPQSPSSTPYDRAWYA
jgi:hypothetical protein